MFGWSGSKLTHQVARVYYSEQDAICALRDALFSVIPGKCDFPVVLVCIGTDRSTGDSLGPLVGSRVSASLPEDCIVYGTLEEPVHAVNLQETLSTIQSKHPNSFVVAIDACLGQLNSVGIVSVHRGPLKPGAGVNKDLPEVGHAHITGIVNVGGFMEYFVLQNTRLSIVMKMADCIANAVCTALSEQADRMPPARAVSLL